MKLEQFKQIFGEGVPSMVEFVKGMPRLIRIYNSSQPICLGFPNKWAESQLNHYNHLDFLENYASFIDKRLEKWVFFPCDKFGSLLLEPEGYGFDEFIPDLPATEQEYNELMREYNEAKERCLFEGWKNLHSNLINNSTIEGLRRGDNLGSPTQAFVDRIFK